MSGCDKFERSPSGMAKCQSCGEKIQKGAPRIGKGYPYKGEWRYKYYHEQCLPADQRAKLKLDSTTSAKLGSSSPATPELVNVALAADLARQDARESVKKELVYETRGELREELRRHRLRLAKQKNQAPYMIFYDQTLDDIVAKLPVNDRELMRCWGIAKKKCDEFGSSIIRIVREYKRREAEEEKKNSEMDNDSNDVEQVAVISCEERVNLKMEENRRNGNEIAIL